MNITMRLCTVVYMAVLLGMNLAITVYGQNAAHIQKPVKHLTSSQKIQPITAKELSQLTTAVETKSEKKIENLKALVITAHPDDETCFAVTMYKITKELGGVVDLAVITNGEGGYKYSTLAEDIYHLKLTDETVGREYLPSIRKRELMAGGKYAGIRNYYFFDQKDTHYTLDADTVLNQVWDVEWVKKRLRVLMEQENYNIVLTLLPTPETHGHHKAATIIALETAQSLTAPAKPIVLGCGFGMKNDTIPTFTELNNYPITHCNLSSPVAALDKTQKFGYNDRLNYTIITSWMVAEHKSQGAMHLGFRSELENFWFFDVNDSKSLPKIKDLFMQMSKTKP